MSLDVTEAASSLRFRHKTSRERQSPGEVGRQILTQVVITLRSRNFEVSDPILTGKALIATATCKVGDDDLELSVAAETHGPAVLLTYRHPRADPRRELSVQDIAEWNDVRQLLIDALRSIEGVDDLCWVSRSEAIRPSHREAKRKIRL